MNVRLKKGMTTAWNMAMAMFLAFYFVLILFFEVIGGYETDSGNTPAIESGVGLYHGHEGALGLISVLGVLVNFFSFFQGQLSLWKRLVLALLCLSPLVFVAASFSIHHGYFRGLLLTACWQYPIPMWLLSAPGIFAGKGVLTFVFGRWRKVPSGDTPPD